MPTAFTWICHEVNVQCNGGGQENLQFGDGKNKNQVKLRTCGFGTKYL